MSAWFNAYMDGVVREVMLDDREFAGSAGVLMVAGLR